MVAWKKAKVTKLHIKPLYDIIMIAGRGFVCLLDFHNNFLVRISSKHNSKSDILHGGVKMSFFFGRWLALASSVLLISHIC